MEFRKIFDTIPEQFDKFRPRYSQELFDNLIDFAKIGPEKKVLEIGPGTGQATDSILNTDCDYNAIAQSISIYISFTGFFHLILKQKGLLNHNLNFQIIILQPYIYPFFIFW